MSGNHRHQRPLISLEKQDSWLSGLLYHVIFFSDLYISAFAQSLSKGGSRPLALSKSSERGEHENRH